LNAKRWRSAHLCQEVVAINISQIRIEDGQAHRREVKYLWLSRGLVVGDLV
jgi:hypothetical protein